MKYIRHPSDRKSCSQNPSTLPHGEEEEFYCELFTSLYHDVVDCYANIRRIDISKDLETFRSRYCAEGMGFLTKTLPLLCKSLDKALATGMTLQFVSFSKKKGTQLPAFCWWLFSEIFDNAGNERSDASVLAVKQLRQILICFYKLELPYDRERTQSVLDQFIKVDESLCFRTDSLLGVDVLIAQNAKSVVCSIMSSLCPRTIKPRHGAGAVSTGEKPAEKRNFARLVRSIEEVYPFTEYFQYNLTQVVDSYDKYKALEEKESGQARIVLVPKDSRGPRIISCEPLENQWIQQGQMRAIVPHLESHPLTRGRLNFTDQTVNQALALQGSLDGTYATLDMKEASDRVDLELVNYLFPPLWVDALKASRSSSTLLPDGRVVHMKKFAPMGSATCFPVEALIFWALCVSVVCCTRGISVAKAAEDLYVYGDDIICLSVDQAQIRQHLPRFGLVLNEGKCCTAGFFRESCGTDAYKGSDVTPTKFRRVWSRILDASSYPAWVSYSNSLHADGFYRTADYIESRVQRKLLTPHVSHQSIATVRKDKSDTLGNPQPEMAVGIAFYRSSEVSRVSNQKLGVKTRWNARYCRHEVRGYVSLPCIECTDAFDWAEMLRLESLRPQPKHCFALDEGGGLPPLSLPPSDAARAGIYAIPRRNRLKRGWIRSHA